MAAKIVPAKCEALAIRMYLEHQKALKFNAMSQTDRILNRTLMNFPPEEQGDCANSHYESETLNACLKQQDDHGLLEFEKLLGQGQKQKRLLVPDLATDWFRKQKLFLDTILNRNIDALKQARCAQAASNKSGADFYARLMQTFLQCGTCCRCYRCRDVARKLKQKRIKELEAQQMLDEQPPKRPTSVSKRDPLRKKITLCRFTMSHCKTKEEQRAQDKRTKGGKERTRSQADPCNRCIDSRYLCPLNEEPEQPATENMYRRLFQDDGQPLGSECMPQQVVQSNLRRMRDLRTAPQRRVHPALYKRISPEFYGLLKSYEEEMSGRCRLYGIPMRHWRGMEPSCACEQRHAQRDYRILGDEPTMPMHTACQGEHTPDKQIERRSTQQSYQSYHSFSETESVHSSILKQPDSDASLPPANSRRPTTTQQPKPDDSTQSKGTNTSFIKPNSEKSCATLCPKSKPNKRPQRSSNASRTTIAQEPKQDASTKTKTAQKCSTTSCSKRQQQQQSDDKQQAKQRASRTSSRTSEIRVSKSPINESSKPKRSGFMGRLFGACNKAGRHLLYNFQTVSSVHGINRTSYVSFNASMTSTPITSHTHKPNKNSTRKFISSRPAPCQWLGPGQLAAARNDATVHWNHSKAVRQHFTQSTPGFAVLPVHAYQQQQQNELPENASSTTLQPTTNLSAKRIPIACKTGELLPVRSDPQLASEPSEHSLRRLHICCSAPCLDAAPPNSEVSELESPEEIAPEESEPEKPRTSQAKEPPAKKTKGKQQCNCQEETPLSRATANMARTVALLQSQEKSSSRRASIYPHEFREFLRQYGGRRAKTTKEAKAKTPEDPKRRHSASRKSNASSKRRTSSKIKSTTSDTALTLSCNDATCPQLLEAPRRSSLTTPNLGSPKARASKSESPTKRLSSASRKSNASSKRRTSSEIKSTTSDTALTLSCNDATCPQLLEAPRSSSLTTPNLGSPKARASKSESPTKRLSSASRKSNASSKRRTSSEIKSTTSDTALTLSCNDATCPQLLEAPRSSSLTTPNLGSPKARASKSESPTKRLSSSSLDAVTRPSGAAQHTISTSSDNHKPARNMLNCKNPKQSYNQTTTEATASKSSDNDNAARTMLYCKDTKQSYNQTTTVATPSKSRDAVSNEANALKLSPSGNHIMIPRTAANVLKYGRAGNGQKSNAKTDSKRSSKTNSTHSGKSSKRSSTSRPSTANKRKDSSTTAHSSNSRSTKSSKRDSRKSTTSTFDKQSLSSSTTLKCCKACNQTSSVEEATAVSEPQQQQTPELQSTSSNKQSLSHSCSYCRCCTCGSKPSKNSNSRESVPEQEPKTLSTRTSAQSVRKASLTSSRKASATSLRKASAMSLQTEKSCSCATIISNSAYNQEDSAAQRSSYVEMAPTRSRGSVLRQQLPLWMQQRPQYKAPAAAAFLPKLGFSTKPAKIRSYYELIKKSRESKPKIPNYCVPQQCVLRRQRPKRPVNRSPSDITARQQRTDEHYAQVKSTNRSRSGCDMSFGRASDRSILAAPPTQHNTSQVSGMSDEESAYLSYLTDLHRRRTEHTPEPAATPCCSTHSMQRRQPASLAELSQLHAFSSNEHRSQPHQFFLDSYAPRMHRCSSQVQGSQQSDSYTRSWPHLPLRDSAATMPSCSRSLPLSSAYSTDRRNISSTSTTAKRLRPRSSCTTLSSYNSQASSSHAAATRGVAGGLNITPPKSNLLSRWYAQLSAQRHLISSAPLGIQLANNRNTIRTRVPNTRTSRLREPSSYTNIDNSRLNRVSHTVRCFENNAFRTTENPRLMTNILYTSPRDCRRKSRDR